MTQTARMPWGGFVEKVGAALIVAVIGGALTMWVGYKILDERLTMYSKNWERTLLSLDDTVGQVVLEAKGAAAERRANVDALQKYTDARVRDVENRLTASTADRYTRQDAISAWTLHDKEHAIEAKIASERYDAIMTRLDSIEKKVGGK